MSIKTPKLGLNGEINPCSESMVDLLNENINILDGSSNFLVERVASLPGTANPGDSFLVDGDTNLYYWTDSFQTYTPNGGEHIFDSTNNVSLVFDGSAWVNTAIDATTASNVGTGAQVFKQKTGNDLEHRTLVAGANISITENANEIEIQASGGSGGGSSLTTVTTQDYSIQAGDTDLVYDASFNIRSIMPDPSLFLGRKLRIYLNGFTSNTLTLKDHTNTNDLFVLRRQDLGQLTFPGGGSIQRAAPYIEFTAMESSSIADWCISSLSKVVVSGKYANTLQTIDGSYNTGSPLVIFQQTLGTTELFNSINVSMSFITQYTASSISDFVFRYETRRSGGSWNAGKIYVQRYERSDKKILYLDETIEPQGNLVHELLEVRLVAYRFQGSFNLTLGDNVAGAFVAEIKTTREV